MTYLRVDVQQVPAKFILVELKVSSSNMSNLLIIIWVINVHIPWLVPKLIVLKHVVYLKEFQTSYSMALTNF
jgi:hypothetical protein